ncbi:MAG: hypothetical protein EOR99_03740 [Mesorhizobium sp.]|nr:MAG: hypothetical protein EOR99_03740 [Mesorhizobium sp.]
MSERLNETALHFQESGAKSSSFFRPASDTPEYFEGAGRRKEVPGTRSAPVRWPKIHAAQKEQFHAWHAVAMQLIDRASVSFRTIGAFYRYVNWQTGTLWPSNRSIAAQVGNCSERTVIRDLKNYEGLGIIQIEMVPVKGKKFRKRIIRLSYPEALPDGVTLPDEDYQGDMGGHPEDNLHGDMGGHQGGDMGGHPTLEETHEGRDPHAA